MEMTLRSLTDDRGVDHEDFLSRAEILQALGNHVLISNCAQYFQLVEILSRYTKKMIGLALGLPSLREIADERYYADLPGGRLEATGRLFRNAVKLYVYPYKDPSSGEIVTADTIRFPSPLQHLHALLLESHRIEPASPLPGGPARHPHARRARQDSGRRPIVAIVGAAADRRDHRASFAFRLRPRRHWAGHRRGEADEPWPASVVSGWARRRPA